LICWLIRDVRTPSAISSLGVLTTPSLTRHITLSVNITMNIGDCHILQEDMTQHETSSLAYAKFNRPYVHIAPDNRKLCISTASHLDRSKVRLLKDCPSRIERRRGGHGGRCELVLAFRDHLQVPESYSKEQYWSRYIPS